MTQGNGQNLMVQGRLVWVMGSTIFEGKTKTDFNTKQPVIGPDGNAKVEYGFGLAIPKIDPRTGQSSGEFTKVWNALHQEAFTIYPNGQLPPNFAMKYKDGDGVDQNGKNFSDREGYAGHIILSCTTMIPIKFFKWESGNNMLVNEGIKCGDYVNVQLNVKAHAKQGQGNAGLYLNPNAVQLIQSGKEIINSPSGDQIFGQNAPAYTGEVVADVAPAMPNVAPGTMPNAPVTPATAPTMPNSAPAVNPHYGVVPPTMQPNNVAPVAPAMPAVGPVQTGVAPAMPPVMGNATVPPAGTMTPTMQPATPAAYPGNAPAAPTMPPMPQ